MPLPERPSINTARPTDGDTGRVERFRKDRCAHWCDPYSAGKWITNRGTLARFGRADIDAAIMPLDDGLGDGEAKARMAAMYPPNPAGRSVAKRSKIAARRPGSTPGPSSSTADQYLTAYACGSQAGRRRQAGVNDTALVEQISRWRAPSRPVSSPRQPSPDF